MILHEQHGAQSYPNGMCLYYLVYTSWYLLCAGVLYQLALACAWVYDSTWTTWSTELSQCNAFILFCLYLFAHALCWCTIPTSTSLCLGVWFYVKNMENRVTQRNEFILFSLYLLAHALCWCTVPTSTSLCLGVCFYLNNLEQLPQWNMFILFSLYLLVYALSWCTVTSSTSLCLGVWFYVNNMEHRTTLIECIYVI